MKVEFLFNGNAKLILTPDTELEKKLIQLAFCDGKIKPNVNCSVTEDRQINIDLCENRP